MKILYIDFFSDGHHWAYLNGLTKNSCDELVVALPNTEIKPLDNKSISFIRLPNFKNNFFSYLIWIWKFYGIVRKNKPDVIHFLYGDFLLRYFGLGLSKRFNTIFTIHTLKEDKAHLLSVTAISKKVTSIVVHTKHIYNHLNRKIKNIYQIEYPCFFEKEQFDYESTCRLFNIPNNKIVLSALGSTMNYKGLDILLDALKISKNNNVFLLIAGEEKDFSKDFVFDSYPELKDKISFVNHRLSDDEFKKALYVSDYIVIPYRRFFNGASGPLAEGVVYSKKIIGCNSKSIGSLINENDLGFSFETESPQDLSRVIDCLLTKKYSFSDSYLNYQSSLNPNSFYGSYSELYKKEGKI